MKPIILILAFMVSMVMQAQKYAPPVEAITDQQGNYMVIKTHVLLVHDSTTANTITDLDGNTFPVYVGPRGGVYFYVQDSLGAWKKRYIKTLR